MAAIAWGRWAAAARQHAMATVGCDLDLVLARKIAVWLQCRHIDSFTKRDAYVARRTVSVRKPADLDGALALLLELGWIRRSAERPGPGRPAERYDVNPTALS